MYTMRFDMRAPAGGASTPELYAAAVDMAAFAEENGGLACVISEHHASPDGYIPSPMLLATAMAARTTRMPISIAALLLPFQDPIRLAEDMMVLDTISSGRVMYTLALGYRPEEFEMFGIRWDERGKVADEKLALLLQAIKGEPFEHEGRRIHVTPAPVTPGGPKISWGGGTKAAARRAARHGLDMFGQIDKAGVREVYEATCREHGHEPGMCMLPPLDSVTTAFVAEDVDRAWEEVGPSILHDVKMYGAWNPQTGTAASISHAQTVDELRAEQGPHRIYSVDEAIALVKAGGMIPLMPLCGGLPPAIAWRYLRVVTDQVMPAVS
jgi:alkanesulfonate monooxygenase SsuD/methylene tetrahydromethanopterin reductase-like flavin-dependent oxidoreductase (luciferase family)